MLLRPGQLREYPEARVLRVPSNRRQIEGEREEKQGLQRRPAQTQEMCVGKESLPQCGTLGENSFQLTLRSVL